MQITNKSGLPKAFVRAVQYVSNRQAQADWSCTELIAPPRVVQLARRHYHEAVADVSDSIWSLFGSSVHYILQKSAERDKSGRSLVEQTLFADINVAGRGERPIWVRISGTIDLIEDDEFFDYKVTSGWAIVDGQGLSPKKDWENQCDVYNFLLKVNRYDMKAGSIVCILRDWNFKTMIQNPNFPRSNVVKLPVALRPPAELRKYVVERVRIHKAASLLPDDLLPLCTPEERWEKATTWAVWKNPGHKRAFKLCSSEAEAEKVYGSIGGSESKAFIEKRAGESPRCLNYCLGAPWCNYRKEIVKVKSEIIQKGKTDGR